MDFLFLLLSPFYGYHQGEHQFLRIQLYNPNLLRRVSNLLQSGTILGKQFQPHESHIPYILKFFIDYNLFGMSYLHVPLQFVNTRYADDKTRFKKRAVSQLEVDFKAIYILNRLAAEESEDTGKAANPGIESIWEDERLRRSAMDSDSVPPLESMKSQGKTCPPTESEVFFKTILCDKLAKPSENSSMNTTMIDEEIPTVKKKFNLKNFLDSSVYAAEFSQSSFSTKSSQGSGKNVDETMKVEESETIEELENRILNFTQDDDEESEMRDVLELLDGCDENEFENDSLLAPLTQVPETFETKPREKSQEIKKNNLLEDSDDEEFNELNVTVAELEMFSQYVKDEEIFPQLDGVDDEIKVANSDDKFEKLSPSEITKLNDKAKNFHPQPGPSNVFLSPLRKPLKIEVPSPSTSILNSQEVRDNLKSLAVQFKTSPKAEMSTNYSEDEFENSDEDDHIKSFYNQTMMVDDFWSDEEQEPDGMTEEDLNKTVKCDVEMEVDEDLKSENCCDHENYEYIDRIPVEKTKLKSEIDEKEQNLPFCPESSLNFPEIENKIEEKSNSQKAKEISYPWVITPVLDPPDPAKVLDFIHEFNIPNRINPVPFYSNPKDVTGKKEVGHNILEILGNSVADLDDFKSSIFEENRLENLRHEIFVKNFGFVAKSSKQAKEFMSLNEAVVIQPVRDPPSFQDAVDWLKSGTKTEDLQESPIKDKREKTFMVLEVDDENSSDLDMTLNSTFVPTTPDLLKSSEEVVMSSQEKETPSLSDFIEDGLFLSYSARKKRNKMKKSSF